MSNSLPTRPQSYTYWSKLRTSNPHLYYSAQVQTRVLADREKLGSDSFWSDKPKPKAKPAVTPDQPTVFDSEPDLFDDGDADDEQ